MLADNLSIIIELTKEFYNLVISILFLNFVSCSLGKCYATLIGDFNARGKDCKTHGLLLFEGRFDRV